MILRHFYCPPCDAWFEAFTRWSETIAVGAIPQIERRTHTCGRLCSPGIQPGSSPGIKTGKMRGDDDRRRVFQRQFGLKDSEMAKLSRADIEHVMARKGLAFVDKAWDDNVNGGKRERGDIVELPPDTEDPSIIREWNEKHLGRAFVQEQQEQIRTVFDAASAGTLEPLPVAEGVAVHETPHIVDVEEMSEALKAAPTVAPERKRELAGKLVTG